MKKWILVFLLSLMPVLSQASGGAACELESADIDIYDKASLQRGSRLFVNYCMGCHSLEFQRFNRLAEDLDIPEDIVMENLNFAGVKIGEQMHNAMSDKDAKVWFGAPPPDLSLKARVRGADWLYTYLKSFYRDESRPFGVDNLCFPKVGMPHALAELQGVQTLVEHTDEHGHVHQAVELETSGEMLPEEYDGAVRDLVNFLVYVGEPVQSKRQVIGIFVIGFLVVLLIFAFLLKREYWRDVH